MPLCNTVPRGFPFGADAEKNIRNFYAFRFDFRANRGIVDTGTGKPFRPKNSRRIVGAAGSRRRRDFGAIKIFEEKEHVKMITGIVLINVERAMIGDVIAGLRKIEGVSEIYSVAGEYDLVAIIRVKDNAQLADIIATKMTRDLDGIIHTKTLVTLTAYSKIDLEKVFLG